MNERKEHRKFVFKVSGYYLTAGAIITWAYMILTGEGWFPFLDHPWWFIVGTISFPGLIIGCIIFDITQAIEEKANEKVTKFMGYRVTLGRVVAALLSKPILVYFLSLIINLFGFYNHAAGMYSIRYSAMIPVALMLIIVVIMAKKEPYFIENKGNVVMNR